MKTEECINATFIVLIMTAIVCAVGDSFIFHHSLYDPTLQFDCVVMKANVTSGDKGIMSIHLKVVDLDQKKIINCKYTMDITSKNFNRTDYQIDNQIDNQNDNQIRKCVRPRTWIHPVECALVPNVVG